MVENVDFDEGDFFDGRYFQEGGERGGEVAGEGGEGEWEEVGGEAVFEIDHEGLGDYLEELEDGIEEEAVFREQLRVC